MTEPEFTKRVIRQLLCSQPIDIPVFHEVALRLQQMMNDHSYRIEDAIILVNQDTALASEMLRHANSTYNSGKTPITTIKNAIVRLGSQQIVNLAFTASMANSKSDNPVINGRLKKLWHHSHAVAVSSSWMAAQIRQDNKIHDIDVDEVYLAGLFHAIGKLYLLKSMDRLINVALMQTDDNLINEMLGELSDQQGIIVMQHCSIPKIYTNSAERHSINNWISGTNDHLVAAVRSCCKICHCVEQGIEVTEQSEAFNLVRDEFSFLDINDVSYVYNTIKAITD